MTGFSEHLEAELSSIQDQGLLRALRRIDSAQGPYLRFQGQSLLNFSSNDYLGLANDPAVRAAAKVAIDTYGAGSGASRLICGSLAPHHLLEETLAHFKGTEAALSFSCGYTAALGVITALLGRDDVILLDKHIHASMVDAARLSRAQVRVFAHNDLNDLEAILKSTDARAAAAASSSPALSQTDTAVATGRPRRPRVLIVTESVFSMDGDLAPLREIVELKERFGAWLLLDEAHATGLFGAQRRGLAEAFDLAPRVEIHLGTLGKALGSAGGYICGSRPLIDFLINRARSFIFSTAPTPAAAAAAAEAIRIVQSPEGEVRRKTLWILVDVLKNMLIGAGWPLPPVQSAIVPLIVGPELQAVALADRLRAQGIFIPAIRYPSVARGQARLRLTMTAAHEPAAIETLKAALGSFDATQLPNQ